MYDISSPITRADPDTTERPSPRYVATGTVLDVKERIRWSRKQDPRFDKATHSKLLRLARKRRYRQKKENKEKIRQYNNKYRNDDDNKEKARQNRNDEDNKEKARQYSKVHYALPRGKEQKKSYANSTKGKATAKIHQSKPEVKKKTAERKKVQQSDPGVKRKMKESTKLHQSNPKVKRKMRSSTKAYQSSEKGRDTRESYLGSPGVQERTSGYRKKSYRKKRFERFADNMDDFDFASDVKRNDALKAIRGHVISQRFMMRFAKMRNRILPSRKSIYLPSLPARNAAESNARKKGIHKTRRFTQSKAKIDFEIAAVRILSENISKDSLHCLLAVLFPDEQLKGKTTAFKIKYAATAMAKRIMQQRDLWVRSLYSNVHRLTSKTESMLAQEVLNKKAAEGSLLGMDCHAKDTVPYFPKCSFKDGKQYTFKKDKRKPKAKNDCAKEENFHRCTENCILATSDEMKRFRSIVERAQSLEIKDSRKFVQDCNSCSNVKVSEVYQLVVEKRNHPESCFSEQTACTSDLVLLRKLSVHYKDARAIYKFLNNMKAADQFISDFDTSTAMGDIGYIMKLLSYKPPITPKVFDVERPDELVNEETMAQKFGDHIAQFYKSADMLPRVPCISCDKLIIDDPKHCKIIKQSWRTIHRPGSRYADLLKYLNSPERLARNEEPVATLIGKRVCNYCYDKLRVGEVPRISVMNGMDTGKMPPEILRLSQFERIFIRQISMYQTFLKLDTNAGNRPRNERLDAIKGFAVHLPIPMNVTIEQLGNGRPGKLLKPENYILLHGLPNKSKYVWQKLINVEAVFEALQWLVVHNPLYSDIVLPDNPEDLFPTTAAEDLGSMDTSDIGQFDFKSDSSLEQFSCESFSSLEDSDPTTASAANDDGSDGDANIGNPVMTSTQRQSQTARRHSNDDVSVDNEISFDCPDAKESVDDEISFDTKGGTSASSNTYKGGEPTVLDEMDHVDYIDPSTAVSEEHPDIIKMWQNSVTVTKDDMAKIELFGKQRSERKYIMAKIIMAYCRKHMCNGMVCTSCDKILRNIRTRLADFCCSGSSDIGFRFFDERSLAQIYATLRDRLLRSTNDVNTCSNCANLLNNDKKKLLDSDILSKGAAENKKCIDETCKQIHAVKTKYLEEMDRMRENGVVCCSCYYGLDVECKTKNYQFLKPKMANVKKVEKKLADARNVYRSVYAMNIVAGVCGNAAVNKFCVCCEKSWSTSDLDVLGKNGQEVLDALSPTVDTEKLSEDEKEELSEDETDEANVVRMSYIDQKSRVLHFTGDHEYHRLSNDEKLANLANNMTCMRDLVTNIKLVRKQKLHCAGCKKDVMSTKKLYKSILKGNGVNSVKIRLDTADQGIICSLLLDSSDRYQRSCNENVCFQCFNPLQSKKSKDDCSSTTSASEDVIVKSADIKGGGDGSDVNDDIDNTDALAFDLLYAFNPLECKKAYDDTRSTTSAIAPEDVIVKSADIKGGGVEDGSDVNDDIDNTDDSSSTKSASMKNVFVESKNVKGGGVEDGSDHDANDDIDDSDADSLADFLGHLADSDNDEEKKEDPPTDEELRKKTKRLLEQMSEEDLKNLIEQYTVTSLETLAENPEYLDDLYRLLRIEDEPVDMKHENLDHLAFPEVFPYGIGGKRGFREEKAMPLYYERARLLSVNAASRRHIQYLFHLVGDQERRKITQSIFAAIKNVHGLRNTDTKTLLDMIKKKDPNIVRRMTRVLGNVPNTEQYWNSQAVKLKAQIEKYGPPTFFATFSPAEYDWEDLVKYLRDNNSDIPNIEQLTPSELMAKDPVLTSLFVHQRFNALWEFLKNAQPLGEVESDFIRHEYQGRGVVHFHTLIWIKDAPVIGKSSDEEVVSFIQKHISCRMPDKSLEQRLYQCVMKYQQHSCRSYCLRKFKPTPGKKQSTACRFGYPRVKSKKFTLHDVLSSVIGRKTNRMKKRLYDLARSEDERRTNDYNPALSYLWRGNMDIQYLAEDSYSICNYVTKYITKADKSHMETNFEDDESKSTFQQFSKFAYASLKSREMSSHEAADRILQNKGELWRSSETFEWVPTTFPKFRSRVLKNIKDLEAQKGDTKELYYPDIIHDFYPCRPKDDLHADMPLYKFALRYEKTTGKLPKDKSQLIEIVRPDGKYLRSMKRRRREPVIYHYNYSLKTKPELFYYSMLSLYKPWQTEADILGPSSTYQEEYFRVVDTLPLLKEMSSRKINIQEARDAMEKKVSEEQDDDPADNAPNDEDDDEPVIAQGLQDFETINEESAIRTEEELAAFVATLNQDQMRVYNKVTQAIEHMFDHENGVCEEEHCSKPLRLYVSGFGGTGKSYLIKAIVGFMYVQTHVFKEKADIMLSAPTGLAGANIGGQTIHSIFNIPVEHGSTPKYKSLNKEALDQMRSVLDKLKCVVCDEISMVSNIMLLYMHLRLQEVFGPSTVFGNKCIILFGDLLQLPPVMGQPPFVEVSGDMVNNLIGGIGIPINLWREFDFDELTVNERQAGDTNAIWKDILGRVRTGSMTSEDAEIINSRLIALKPATLAKDYREQIIDYFLEMIKKDKSAVCLLPTRKMVSEFNNSILEREFPNSICLQSEDSCDGKNKKMRKNTEDAVKRLDSDEDSRNTGGLDKNLQIAIGVRLMLRRNMDVSKGLVNGSIGTLKEIVRDRNQKVVKLMVQFDGVAEPVPIERACSKIRIFANSFLERKQFPVTLAYGLTIHKAQGLSLKTVLADLGSKVFVSGQSYVALSRVTSLEGLHLINFSPMKVKANEQCLIEYRRLGSRPVMDMNGDDLQKEKKKRKRCAFGERVWYTTGKAKKAISTVEAGIGDTLGDDGKKKKKSTKGKGPAPKKQKRPTGNANNANDLTVSTMNLHINRIYTLAFEGSVSPDVVNLVTPAAMHRLYQVVMIPSTLNPEGDGFRYRLGRELNPDAFDVARSHSKWLSGEILLKYVMYMQDNVMAHGGPSLYNIGPYARFCFNQRNRRGMSTRSTRNNEYIHDYVHWTFSERRYSAYRENLTIPFETIASVINAGDPLQHDCCIMFGNEHNDHWYAVILDNLEGRRKVTYFDSGGYTTRQMEQRCQFHVDFIADFRVHLRDRLRMTIPEITIDRVTHPFVDGQSSPQQNGFDCGVFALSNSEQYVLDRPNTVVTQSAMKLIRCKIISNLWEFAERSGIIIVL